MVDTNILKETPICPHCGNYNRHHMYPLKTASDTSFCISYRKNLYGWQDETVTPLICAACGTVFIPTWKLNRIIVDDMDFDQNISDEPVN